MPHLEQIESLQKQTQETIANLQSRITAIFSTPLSFGGGKARLSQSRARASSADALRAQIAQISEAAEKEKIRILNLEHAEEIIKEVITPTNIDLETGTITTGIEVEPKKIDLKKIAIIGGAIILLS